MTVQNYHWCTDPLKLNTAHSRSSSSDYIQHLEADLCLSHNISVLLSEMSLSSEADRQYLLFRDLGGNRHETITDMIYISF